VKRTGRGGRSVGLARGALPAFVLGLLGLFSSAPAAWAAGSPVAPQAALEPSPPAPPAELDPAGVSFFPDEGRLELRGRHLEGVRVRWPAPADGSPAADTATAGGESREDRCVAPKPLGAAEQCTLTLPRGLRADAPLVWLPRAGAGETGAPLRPARIVLDRLLPPAASVDLTSGVGRIALVHPEAVAVADCAQARCELGESGIQVLAISGSAASLSLRLRLAPHVFLRRGEALDPSVTLAISVLHCTMTIASGPPLRRAELARVVLRMDDRCGDRARDLRWTANGDPAEVQRIEKDHGLVFVQLGVGDVEDAQLTITASRPEPDGSVIAVARSATRPAPQPRATLELPGLGPIDFIPTNRDALVRPGPAGDHAHLVVLPVEDVYRVGASGGRATIRGEPGAAGLVTLRYGYRVDGLPGALASTDLAVLTGPLQRPLREASVPAPLGASTLGPAPLLELVCADRRGQPERIPAGTQTSIPFAQRDSCRLVIHRERLTPEQGTQDVAIDVAVTKEDDNPRADARVTERMVLRPGGEPRVYWLHGVKAAFDRLTVRVSHIVDEAHDVGGADLHVNLPSAQWAVVAGEGHLRFYATAAIPTGLYRITAPSDVLTLNFGALGRLTWLDAEGHEGLLGLELGAMGIGLAATPGFPRTLAVLAGLGLSVPIGNRGEASEAALNLHAWLAYELRGETPRDPTDPLGPAASHWSFLFGPSITFGNVGTNL
jgi:hypothetical protein